jgi:uncharacterized iron-regulated membrane protein
MVVIVIVTLYLSATGTMIQLVDLRSIFTHAPADDPNVEAMREAADGPGNYAVISPKDYTAPALPQGVDLQGLLSRVMQSARMTVGGIPLRYVELRMAGGKPVGIVESAGRLAQFDAITGQIISAGPPPRPTAPPVSQFHQSTRNMFKVLHRMTLFGNYALFINVIVGVGLITMIVTGLVMYFKMLAARRKSGPSGLFWVGEGTNEDWKRAVHRGLGLVSAAFLMVVALSGLWLAYESLYLGFYMGSATQRSESQAFAAAQKERLAALPKPAPRPDPLSAEAQPGRLAAMQQDIGLTPDERVKIKAITDDSVKKNLELHKAGPNMPDIDSQGARGNAPNLHQEEANAIMSVLTDDQKPRFLAWRNAQLLGMPVNNGPGRQAQGGQQNGGGNGGGGDPSSPLQDAELPSMLSVTFAAEQSFMPNTPLKVVRLRYYAGMPQGAVITGGADTRQIVFNAQTGKAVSETEPGYPPTGFPFGWQAHQTAKNIHRGGVIGVTGRLMDLFAGLSLFYLSINGAALYYDYWKLKRKTKQLVGQRGQVKPA